MTNINKLAMQGFDIFCREIERQPLKSRTFQPLEYLLHQGQDILELYWVGSGEFTIGYTANNGRNYSLGLNLVDNHLFGEVEYLTSSPCQFNIQASELAEAKVLPIKVMTEILQLDPKVGIWMSQALSSRYQTGMTMTMNRFLHPLIYNIAWDMQQRCIGARPAVNFSHVYKEAERFGCSERVYSRVVNQLLDMDLIEKRDNQLHVKDLQKLAQFLEMK
ncbi:Crp/Fnr family transcriptional regulator [Shewanella eurypsychrophilus]|uniref:Crp/Fnr family transcriptional regulator n=1 Tax=Shewanella eurypsychrophilus TaxID=2593656 RepID=A0ABX6VB84_9GAMM|nr:MULTISPECIES: Crp/Fnr family transcriptional regulator [Shewanella]QFU23936.1 cyclic nucleotide-binding domain-containing protein [Shewanella sp. YLB-09]QPG59152.1 Crp/Fnr family transcriptional regulator [Shewanella eurypsychrophilus]